MPCSGMVKTRVGGCNCEPPILGCAECGCGGRAYALSGTYADANGTHPMTYYPAIDGWRGSYDITVTGVKVYRDSDDGTIRCTAPQSITLRVTTTVLCRGGFVRVIRSWLVTSCSGTWRYVQPDIFGVIPDNDYVQFDADPSDCDPLEVTGTPGASLFTADPVGGDISVSIPVATEDCTPVEPADCEPCSIPDDDLCLDFDNNTWGKGRTILAHSGSSWQTSCITLVNGDFDGGTSYQSFSASLVCDGGSTDLIILGAQNDSSCSDTDEYSVASGDLTLASSSCDPYELVFTVNPLSTLHSKIHFDSFTVRGGPCPATVPCGACDFTLTDLTVSWTRAAAAPGSGTARPVGLSMWGTDCVELSFTSGMRVTITCDPTGGPSLFVEWNMIQDSCDPAAAGYLSETVPASAITSESCSPFSVTFTLAAGGGPDSLYGRGWRTFVITF